MNAVFSILLNYAEHPVLLAVLPSARHPEGLKHLPWNANVGLLEVLLLFSPPCMPYMHRCARPWCSRLRGSHGMGHGFSGASRLRLARSCVCCVPVMQV